MKIKTFNHFRNLFAFVGFFIIACSAAVDDSPVEEPPVVQSNNGKYQIEYFTSNIFIVLNTATGVTKTYRVNCCGTAGDGWVNENANVTFTH